MTDNDDRDPEALLESSKTQRRDQTEPSGSESDTHSDRSLEDSIRDAYADLDDGTLNENLTIRDKHLAAIFAGLEDRDETERVSSDTLARLGRDDEDVNRDARNTALRFLVRVGLEEVAPDTLEAAKAARKTHLLEKADEI